MALKGFVFQKGDEQKSQTFSHPSRKSFSH